jgi:5S rRNA maturation endonuclease (ribonuclease M5)
MQNNRNAARARGTYDGEALEELISALVEASDRGAAIIVEGRRDQESLRALGVQGQVIMASQKPALILAEDAAKKFQEIIVLTDWDKKGEEMALQIKKYLCCSGSRCDVEIRSRLRRLVKKEIKDVESLSRYVERMRELYGT